MDCTVYEYVMVFGYSDFLNKTLYLNDMQHPINIKSKEEIAPYHYCPIVKLSDKALIVVTEVDD